MEYGKLSFVLRGKLAAYHAVLAYPFIPAHLTPARPFQKFPAERPSYIIFFHPIKTEPSVSTRFSKPPKPPKLSKPLVCNSSPAYSPCHCCVLVGPQDTWQAKNRPVLSISLGNLDVLPPPSDCEFAL